MKQQIGFFQHMRLPQKFMLLGVLALVLAAIPIYNLLDRSQTEIGFVRTEQAGMVPITSTLELVKTLQDHRASASYFVLKDEKRGADQPKHAAAVEAAFSKLDSQIGSLNDPAVAERLTAFKRQWASLKDNVTGRKIEQRRVTEDHIAIIREVLRVVEELTAYYKIDLEPDASTYYMFQSTLVALPLLSETIGQLRSPVVSRLQDLASARANADHQGKPSSLDAALRDAYRPTDRLRIAETIKDLQEVLDRYVALTQKAVRAAPTLEATVGVQVADIKRATQQAIDLVKREILGKEFPTIDAGVYLKDVTVPREAVQKAVTQQTLLTQLLQRRAEQLRVQRFKSVGGVLALLLLAAAVGAFIVRSITEPLGKLIGAVRRLESGDDSARANLHSSDEMGELGAAFDAMMDVRVAKLKRENDQLNESVLGLLQGVAQLSRKDLTVKVRVTEDVTGPVADALNVLTGETAKVLQQVSDISASVTAASLKVKAQSDTVMHAAAEERVQVDATTASLVLASQSMTQIAAMAQQCNSAAARAIKTTEDALETVTTTVGGINSTRDTIRETEKRIKRLGERSQEISGAVNLINSIAERTHILALNASMHAASAGEAGRGFAVVADEVQRLAESARQATQQIATLVGNIQVETSDTVTTMNSAISQVVEGSRLAEQAGRQMQVTQRTTAELVESVQQIAIQSQEQAKASHDLLERAGKIKLSTQETDRQLTEQTQQTGALVDYARNLLATVRVFKLTATA
ncbi:MAG: HAMP domain-containing methyl-accepting chemotaxis protein [Burkholderiaceae bacterium]